MLDVPRALHSRFLNSFMLIMSGMFDKRNQNHDPSKLGKKTPPHLIIFEENQTVFILVHSHLQNVFGLAVDFNACSRGKSKKPIQQECKCGLRRSESSHKIPQKGPIRYWTLKSFHRCEYQLQRSKKPHGFTIFSEHEQPASSHRAVHKRMATGHPLALPWQRGAFL